MSSFRIIQKSYHKVFLIFRIRVMEFFRNVTTSSSLVYESTTYAMIKHYRLKCHVPLHQVRLIWSTEHPPAYRPDYENFRNTNHANTWARSIRRECLFLIVHVVSNRTLRLRVSRPPLRTMHSMCVSLAVLRSDHSPVVGAVRQRRGCPLACPLAGSSLPRG